MDLSEKLRGLATGECGQSTAFLALFAGLCALGFVAVGLDVGYLFHEKRMAQAAADAAALAAAEEYTAGDSSNAQAAANAVAKMNGFDPGASSNPATVTLTTPSSGNFQYSSSDPYVQAVVSRPIPTFFGAFAKSATVTVSAQAIAGGGQAAPTCVCLLGPSGEDLNLSNDSKIQATTCGVTDDSSSSNAAGVQGSAQLNALTLGLISTTWTAGANVGNGGSTDSTRIITGIQTACNPTMPAAPTYNASQCTADPLGSYGNGGSSYSVGPGSGNGTTQTGNVICYNALTLGANADNVDILPGTYVINGGELHFESGTGGHSNTGGNGVAFYLTGNASLVIDNGANVNLNAMSTGTYANILVYQAASDTQTVNFQGGASTVFNGALYAPGAPVDLANGTGTTITAEIVAQTLTMAGGGTLVSNPTINLGTLNFSVAKLVQ